MHRIPLYLIFAILTLAHTACAIGFPSIEAEVHNFQSANPRLEKMYRLALRNTGKQMSLAKDGTYYVKTGDIPAEWLRDSSAQVRPYLYFVKADPELTRALRGVIERHGKYLAQDPYANAFREDYSIWERKFELDSLAYPILLAWTFWKTTGDASVFSDQVRRGFEAALETMEIEQDHLGLRPPHRKSTYAFQSDTELAGANPVGYTGMIWTGFRPSDDPCTYNYLIPAEMMAVQALEALAEISRQVWRDRGLEHRARRLAKDVRHGIEKFALFPDPSHPDRKIYAYEVDGLGNKLLMDDANLPSLLSAPYFGYISAADPVYQNTRRFILSAANPYFYSGKLGAGVGSPHTPKGMVWPLALVTQGLTSSDPKEIDALLEFLLASDPGDNQLHESFDPNDPTRFTRPDFGWPNALLVELIGHKLLSRPLLPVPKAAAQK